MERPWTCDGIKGGVGNVAVDLAADHEAGPAIDHLEADSPGAQRGIHMASKCVESLVIMAVEIEELEFGHGLPPS